jgi:hypothetical protein
MMKKIQIYFSGPSCEILFIYFNFILIIFNLILKFLLKIFFNCFLKNSFSQSASNTKDPHKSADPMP